MIKHMEKTYDISNNTILDIFGKFRETFGKEPSYITVNSNTFIKCKEVEKSADIGGLFLGIYVFIDIYLKDDQVCMHILPAGTRIVIG